MLMYLENHRVYNYPFEQVSSTENLSYYYTAEHNWEVVFLDK